MQKIIEGTWKALDYRRAFVEGAKWWEFHKTGATMWQSDRATAEEEAEKRWGAAQQSVERIGCTCRKNEQGEIKKYHAGCPEHDPANR